MPKTTALACVVAAGVLAAAPVLADCRADIQAAQDAASALTDAKLKAAAEMHLDMARAELAKENEEACSKHVASANENLSEKPEMKTKP